MRASRGRSAPRGARDSPRSADSSPARLSRARAASTCACAAAAVAPWLPGAGPLRRPRTQRPGGGAALRPQGAPLRARPGPGPGRGVRRPRAAAGCAGGRIALGGSAVRRRRRPRLGGGADRPLRDRAPSGGRALRELRASLWGVAAFALGYLLPGTLRLPTLAYDPVARTVGFSAQVGGVAMRYYG